MDRKKGLKCGLGDLEVYLLGNRKPHSQSVYLYKQSRLLLLFNVIFSYFCKDAIVSQKNVKLVTLFVMKESVHFV